MYAVEYISELSGLCKMVYNNLCESGIKFITKGIDDYNSANKIYKAPYTEFFTDNGVYIDHKIGFVSVADIKHLISIYDKEDTH